MSPRAEVASPGPKGVAVQFFTFQWVTLFSIHAGLKRWICVHGLRRNLAIFFPPSLLLVFYFSQNSQMKTKQHFVGQVFFGSMIEMCYSNIVQWSALPAHGKQEKKHLLQSYCFNIQRPVQLHSWAQEDIANVMNMVFGHWWSGPKPNKTYCNSSLLCNLTVQRSTVTLHEVIGTFASSFVSCVSICNKKLIIKYWKSRMAVAKSLQ